MTKNLNVALLTEKLNSEGKELASSFLKNKEILKKIEDAWNNETENKISYRVLGSFEKDTSTKAHKGKNGFSSVIFLENDAKEKEPYLIGSVIKQGGKAILKNAYNLATGAHVALKITRDLNDLSENEVKREISGLQFLNRYHAEKKLQKKHYLAQKFIRGISLGDYSDTLNEQLNQKEISINMILTITHIIANMSETLSSLHAEGYIHRDIKKDNVMLLENLGISAEEPSTQIS